MNIRGKSVFLVGFAASLAAGWLAFPRMLYESIPQPLAYNHAVHMGEKGGMTCDSCHDLRADGSFTGIPKMENCSACHAGPIGETQAEITLVEEYVTPEKEVPWLVYSRQPDNVYFSHVYHTRLAELSCERCHGNHGGTETTRVFQRNRISGYSRDIWGPSMVRLPQKRQGGDHPPGMKMVDCVRCHEQENVVLGCLGCHK